MGLRQVPDELADLVAKLRSIDGLIVRGKSQSTFYVGSRPFLHFHDGPGGLEADVRFSGPNFERVPVNTKAEQTRLLKSVRSHLVAK